jgi:hypothetical protein
MKYLLAFLLCNSFAFGAVRPLDRVYAFAGKHKVAVRLVSGVYWVEMEDSDVFGVGPTLDDAAEDFLGDADLEAHEGGKPYLTLHSGEQEAVPFVCPQEDSCI